MSTSARKPRFQEKAKKARVRRSYVPTTALAKSVEFDHAMMNVMLTDGRIVCVPLVWFPVLLKATPEQRHLCEIGGGGMSLHWPELDEGSCPWPD